MQGKVLGHNRIQYSIVEIYTRRTNKTQHYKYKTNKQRKEASKHTGKQVTSRLGSWQAGKEAKIRNRPKFGTVYLRKGAQLYADGAVRPVSTETDR